MILTPRRRNGFDLSGRYHQPEPLPPRRRLQLAGTPGGGDPAAHAPVTADPPVAGSGTGSESDERHVRRIGSDDSAVRRDGAVPAPALRGASGRFGALRGGDGSPSSVPRCSAPRSRCMQRPSSPRVGSVAAWSEPKLGQTPTSLTRAERGRTADRTRSTAPHEWLHTGLRVMAIASLPQRDTSIMICRCRMRRLAPAYLLRRADEHRSSYAARALLSRRPTSDGEPARTYTAPLAGLTTH